jgi:mannose-6-phosphate isomerase-like protein (cupin superfamily)
MNGTRVKETVVVMVIMCFAGGVFVSGCSTHHNDDHNHNYKDAAMPSGKVLVIDLANSSEYQRLLGGKPQTCGMRSGRVYLQPGETCGRHSTEQHEEMLVFLSGRGLALIGGEENSYPVGKGKVSYIPPHTIHNIKNTGTEPLIYIYCVTPVVDQSGEQKAGRLSHEKFHEQ